MKKLKRPSWYKNLNIFQKQTGVVNSGVFAKPKWWDAIRDNPPVHHLRNTDVPPHIVFPEDALEDKVLRAYPWLKLERAELTDQYCIPIRHRFAKKQLTYMDQKGMSEIDAFKQCEIDFKSDFDEFTEKLKESGGGLAEQGRHDMMSVLKQREAAIWAKRQQVHKDKFLEIRKQTVGEEVLSRLNRDEFQQPLTIHGDRTGQRQFKELNLDAVDEDSKDLVEEMVQFMGFDGINAKTYIKESEIILKHTPRTDMKVRGRYTVPKSRFEE